MANNNTLAQEFLREKKVYDFTSNEYGLTEEEFDFIFDQLENQKYFMEDEMPEEDRNEEDYKLIKSILQKAKSHGWKSWGERHHE